MCTSFGSKVAYARYAALSRGSGPGIEVNVDVIEALKNTPVFIPNLPVSSMPQDGVPSSHMSWFLQPDQEVLPADPVRIETRKEDLPVPLTPFLPESAPSTPELPNEKPWFSSADSGFVPDVHTGEPAQLDKKQLPRNQQERETTSLFPTLPQRENEPVPEPVAVLPKPAAEPLPTESHFLPEVAVVPGEQKNVPSVEEPASVVPAPSVEVAEDNIQTLPWLASLQPEAPLLPTSSIKENLAPPEPEAAVEPQQPEMLPAKPKRSLFAWLPFSGYRSKTAQEASASAEPEIKSQGIETLSEAPVTAEVLPEVSETALRSKPPSEVSSDQPVEDLPQPSSLLPAVPVEVSVPDKEAVIHLPEPDGSLSKTVLDHEPGTLVPSSLSTEKPEEKHSFFSDLFGLHKKERVEVQAPASLEERPQIAVEEDRDNQPVSSAPPVKVPSIFDDGNADEQFIVLKDSKTQKSKFAKKEAISGKHKEKSSPAEPEKPLLSVKEKTLPRVPMPSEPEEVKNSPAALPESPVVATADAKRTDTKISEDTQDHSAPAMHTNVLEENKDISMSPDKKGASDIAMEEPLHVIEEPAPSVPDASSLQEMPKDDDVSTHHPETVSAPEDSAPSLPVVAEAEPEMPPLPSLEPEAQTTTGASSSSENRPSGITERDSEVEKLDTQKDPSEASLPLEPGSALPSSGEGGATEAVSETVPPAKTEAPSVLYKMKSWFGKKGSEPVQTSIPPAVSETSSAQQTPVSLGETKDITIATNDIDSAGSITAIASLPAPELPEASVPSAATEGEFHIDFDNSEANLSESDKQRLLGFLGQLSGNKKMVKVVTYAKALDGKVASAQRISLQRSIAIRSYLIQQGVEGSRIRVQALGDQGKGVDSATVSIE